MTGHHMTLIMVTADAFTVCGRKKPGAAPTFGGVETQGKMTKAFDSVLATQLPLLATGNNSLIKTTCSYKSKISNF